MWLIFLLGYKLESNKSEIAYTWSPFTISILLLLYAIINCDCASSQAAQAMDLSLSPLDFPKSATFFAPVIVKTCCVVAPITLFAPLALLAIPN